MKIKRFTKLALAGVGLAATAATLTTSTYAWYVTNSKVEATGVQGSVNSTGNGQFYIAYQANDGVNPTAYGTKVEFDTEAADSASGKYTVTALGLLPQSRATAESINKADLETGWDAAAESIVGTGTDAQKKYNFAAYTYNNTLESGTYYMDGESSTIVPAEGAYDSEKKYYSDSTGTIAQDPTTYDAADPADVKKLTPATYNATLTSNKFKVKNPSTGAFTFATGAYSNSVVYFDSQDAIALGDWVDADGYKTTNTSIDFKFWLKSGEDATITPRLLLDNITESVSAQVLTAAGTSYTGNKKINNPLIADAVKALRMEVSVFEAKDSNYTPETFTGETAAEKLEELKALIADHEVFAKTDGAEAGTYVYALVPADVASFDDSVTYVKRNVTKTVYNVDKFALDAKGLTNYTTAGSTAATEYAVPFTDMTTGSWDANIYYYQNMAKAAYNTATANGASEATAVGVNTWAAFNLDQNVDTLFTFKIYLEGSDADCWDSCKGQNFTFNFDFSAAPRA